LPIIRSTLLLSPFFLSLSRWPIITIDSAHGFHDEHRWEEMIQCLTNFSLHFFSNCEGSMASSIVNGLYHLSPMVPTIVRSPSV
jgi:hypothetical protein